MTDMMISAGIRKRQDREESDQSEDHRRSVSKPQDKENMHTSLADLKLVKPRSELGTDIVLTQVPIS